MSVSSEAKTGNEYDWPKPTMTRVQNIWNGLTTRPLSTVAAAHPSEATHTMRTRDIRSASQASGMAPSTSEIPPKAAMPMRVVSLTFSVSWMSGASTPRATRSNCSNIASRASTVIMAVPPTRSVSRRGIDASPTPGRRSSGRTVTSERAACSAWRLASSSRTAPASAAGSSMVRSGAGTCAPGPVSAGWARPAGPAPHPRR